MLMRRFARSAWRMSRPSAEDRPSRRRRAARQRLVAHKVATCRHVSRRTVGARTRVGARGAGFVLGRRAVSSAAVVPAIADSDRAGTDRPAQPARLTHQFHWPGARARGGAGTPGRGAAADPDHLARTL